MDVTTNVDVMIPAEEFTPVIRGTFTSFIVQLRQTRMIYYSMLKIVFMG